MRSPRWHSCVSLLMLLAVTAWSQPALSQSPRQIGIGSSGVGKPSDLTIPQFPPPPRTVCGDYYDWDRSALARGVQSDTPWAPIDETDVFGADDSIYAWNRVTNITRAVRTHVLWISPGGDMYAEDETDWTPDGEWDWWVSWFWYAPGDAIHDQEGLWTVEWDVEEDHESAWCHEATQAFVSKYHLVDQTTCKDVNSVFEPVRRTRYFLPTDPRAVCWMRLEKVRGASYMTQWVFHDPSGALYSAIEFEIEDPEGQGFDHWAWYVVWAYINVEGAAAASLTGEWSVSVSIDGEHRFTEPFFIGLPCPGDLDGDNAISLSDLAIQLSHFGTDAGAVYEVGDIDGDGDVDLQDLSDLLLAFGGSCP